MYRNNEFMPSDDDTDELIANGWENTDGSDGRIWKHRDYPGWPAGLRWGDALRVIHGEAPNAEVMKAKTGDTDNVSPEFDMSRLDYSSVSCAHNDPNYFYKRGFLVSHGWEAMENRTSFTSASTCGCNYNDAVRAVLNSLGKYTRPRFDGRQEWEGSK